LYHNVLRDALAVHHLAIEGRSGPLTDPWPADAGFMSASSLASAARMSASFEIA
jgi:hypothetical protein